MTGQTTRWGSATPPAAGGAGRPRSDRGRARQNYPGAWLDDIDDEAVGRALGRQAVDDMAALRQIERELQRQGYLQRPGSCSSPRRRCVGSGQPHCAGYSPTPEGGKGTTTARRGPVG